MKKATLITIFLAFPLISSFKASETVYCFILPEVKEYSSQNNIFEADSILALAMLLNRECPTCPYEEKVYWASCVTYAVTKGMWTWQEHLFAKGQFWKLKDKRIRYSPKKRLHQENLKAVQEAWKNPKPVMFYASKIDTMNNSIHYRQVKRNSVWKGHHYYSLTLK